MHVDHTPAIFKVLISILFSKIYLNLPVGLSPCEFLIKVLYAFITPYVCYKSCQSYPSWLKYIIDFLAPPFIRALRLHYASHSRKCACSREVQVDETIKPWWLVSGEMWFCLLTGPRPSAWSETCVKRCSAGEGHKLHLGWPGTEHKTPRLETGRSSFTVSKSMGHFPLIGILGHLGEMWALEVRVSLCCNKDLVRIWLVGC
jgi:hypothetical protein